MTNIMSLLGSFDEEDGQYWSDFEDEQPEPEEPKARHLYEIRTIDDNHVTVYASTNDDLDLGYPSKPESWTSTFTTRGNKSALSRALEYCGKSRVGVNGSVVTVRLNGDKI